MFEFPTPARRGFCQALTFRLRHPRRRRSMVAALSLIAVLVTLIQTTPAAAAPPHNRTNIVYIMADDLGYGDLGCYGQQTIPTPHLDRMAAEGLRFTDHYAGHTVCRPSRLTLWLGQHVGHTGLNGNRSRNLTGTESTVARLLQSAGYRTGGVGKWSLGNVDNPEDVDNPGHPNDNGFDYWFGYLNQSRAHNYYPLYLWENRTQVALPGNVLSTQPKARGRVSSRRITWSHDRMTAAALDFIRRHRRDPFLLHIHWTVPHANNEGGRVLGNGMEVPDHGEFADRDWPAPEKGFAAMVTRMDADVGRLLALLRELSLDESTLVIFTSDNGPHREGGHDHEFFDSNGPLRGYKRSMHEGGIRVPLIARWPGTIAPGTTTDHPSAFWDFLPTACEIAGVDPPDNIDGISYLPTLQGRPNDQRQHEYLYWSSSEGATAVGVRMGRWKLVQPRPRKPKNANADPADDAEWLLFDLSTDVGETRDLADVHPTIVSQMRDLLTRDELLP